MGLYGGNGLYPSLGALTSNVWALKAGQVQIIPAGRFMIKPGPYSCIQQYDQITGLWRTIGGGGNGASVEFITSDGASYRVANQNGCVVGAVITNVGSGYTSAPSVTTTGGAILKAIIGGAVGQTITVTNAGTNYTYAPFVVFSAPPNGGVQATGYCTLSAGTVSTVTVVDQGAGYASAPTVSFINDPREGLNGTTVGYNAAATAVLTGAGTITAILCLDHGSPIAYTAGSATSIPTITISGGGGLSGAATALMNWSIVGLQSGSYSNGTSGVTGAQAWLTGIDQPTAANSTVLNTAVQANLVKGRQASLSAAISGGVLPAYSAWVVRDGGIYQGTPLLVIMFDQITTPGGVTGALATMGYFASDTTYIMTQ